MNLKRAFPLAASVVTAAGLLAAPFAAAQTASTSSGQAYPVKPVRVIVPFGAGGPAAISARFLSQRLQGPLGQPFVVEDRPGAGSIIGTDIVAKSPPDR